MGRAAGSSGHGKLQEGLEGVTLKTGINRFLLRNRIDHGYTALEEAILYLVR